VLWVYNNNNNNDYIYIALHTKNKFLSASQSKYKRLSKLTGKLKLEIYNNNTKGTRNIQYITGYLEETNIIRLCEKLL
jgi:hypothetical protein